MCTVWKLRCCCVVCFSRVCYFRRVISLAYSLSVLGDLPMRLVNCIQLRKPAVSYTSQNRALEAGALATLVRRCLCLSPVVMLLWSVNNISLLSNTCRDMTSYGHGGDHDVISGKVLPSGECTRSVCPAHMQQRPPVPDPYLLYVKQSNFASSSNSRDLSGKLSHGTETGGAVGEQLVGLVHPSPPFFCNLTIKSNLRDIRLLLTQKFSKILQLLRLWPRPHCTLDSLYLFRKIHIT